MDYDQEVEEQEMLEEEVVEQEEEEVLEEEVVEQEVMEEEVVEQEVVEEEVVEQEVVEEEVVEQEVVEEEVVEQEVVEEEVVEQEVVEDEVVEQEVVEQEVVEQEVVEQQVFDAMALDCALDGDFMPVKDMNEEFILRRNFIEFHVHVEDQGHYRGNGHLVLTTKRLILVNRDDPSWGSFSLPLIQTFDEQFEEGMAGRFHINGWCRNDNGILPNNAHFKVWFNQGGALRFQHIYKHVLRRARDDGLAFGDIMVELQDPMFVQRCNEFGPCDEEEVFFMEVQPVPVVQEQVMVQQEVVQQQMFDALALDCALDGDFLPVRDMNEQFVLRRNFIEFHIHVEDQGHFRGNGHLVLTTKRLVLVNRDDPSWGSFSLPLVQTFDEQFEEGMAGRFHINAWCRNDMGLLPNNAHFKVWFNQGGGLRFQHTYRHVMRRAKEGLDFNGIIVEMQQPDFMDPFNGFGPCDEEEVFFIQPAPMMQQPMMMQQPVMQQQMMMQQQVQQQQMFDALAIDCALDGEFMPVRDMNEQFVLRRNFIEFHIHVRDRGDFRGRGHLILTTKRLVLVNREDPSWGSFSLPLIHTFNEQFDEGMMGRFHIDAHCRNDMGLLPHNAHFKVWFEQGGGLRFQHIYRHVMRRAKEGLDFNGMMMELQDPMFVGRCEEFGPCQEETLFFMQVQQPIMVVPAQEPYQQERIMQQEVVVEEVRPQRIARDDGFEEGSQNKGCCTIF